MKKDIKLVTTVGENCKLCYTCVRDCPAKAIRIFNGQAEVIPERCIGCGNCVRVCKQNAKKIYDSIGDVRKILNSDVKKVAIIAPSFPAEFFDINYKKLVPMIKKLGFDIVSEVAFGADLVAENYRMLIKNNPGKRYIATTCPGIVAYIEKYHPQLVKYLAPLASPMITAARALRILTPDIPMKIVFIGPCLAKKAEAARDESKTPDVDAVLTFTELREMFEQDSIIPEKAEAVFDPPNPGLGGLFPLRGGMLQAAEMQLDLLSSEIMVADGKNDFVQAIKEFEDGPVESRLLEILCCEGCIMGSGIKNDLPFFARRSAVSRYVSGRIKDSTQEERKEFYGKLLKKLNMKVSFEKDDHRLPMPSKTEIEEILAKLGKFKPEDELDCGACGYSSCREHAIAIHKGMAETEMCLPYTIELLKKSLDDLKISNNQLESTRQALFNSEKLASMGQLSAGIAHEINNPLGVILLNANLLLESLRQGSDDYEDLKMIVDQAERCKKIVSGLLNFARKNKVVQQTTNIANLIRHCVKAIVVPDNIEIEISSDMKNPEAEADPDQIIQVLTNLIVNAFESMPGGGRVKVSSSDTKNEIIIKVIDTGSGISEDIRKKVFEPLFTTKQIGQGTGLGLAVSYGIIKMHKGKIDFTSNCNPANGPTGTEFTVTLPRYGKQ